MGGAMYKALVLVIALLWESVAFADQVLSEREAQQLVEELTKSNCGILIPIKEFDFITIEAMEGSSMYLPMQDVLALKDAGVIKMINLPTMLGKVHFRTELSDSVDKSQLVKAVDAPNSPLCIKMSVGGVANKIVKIDNLKGGVTKWDGAVVYVSTSFQATDLYAKYLTARKLSDRIGAFKRRILYRHDPFRQPSWIFRAADIGPIQGEFTASRVPAALQQD
jgi:hypothetical protein